MSRQKNGHLAPYGKLLDPFKWIDANLTAVAPVAPAPAAVPTVPAAEAAPVPAPAVDTPVVDFPAPAASAAPATPAAIDYVDDIARELELDIKKYPKLVPGAKNRYVVYVQKKMKLPVTGVYDDKTKKAVVALQKKNHFVADGVFGKLTWNKIVEL
jgi:hypothetical protein